MKNAIRIVDDFCPLTDRVRESFLASGFGKWTPNKGKVGSSIYTGMNYTGDHALLLYALATALGGHIFPNSMFARVSNLDTEKAYIHSDRMMGSRTCIAYLSKHDEISGTAFWRHKKTGLTEMPTFEEQERLGIAAQLADDMVTGDPDKWEQLDFVRGIYNRALIFHAPLFHSRFPLTGIGTSESDGRLIWGCHFYSLGPKGELV